MLYEGGILGTISLWLLAVSAGALIGVLPVVGLASKIRWPRSVLIALIYLPILLVVVDFATAALQTSTLVAWLAVALLAGWAITAHRLILVRRRKTTPTPDESTEIRLPVADPPTIREYEEALSESDSDMTVEGLTEKAAFDVCQGTRVRLLADLREGNNNGKPTYGWSQFFNDNVPPSSIGTAYGLRLASVLNIRTDLIEGERAVRSVLSLERPGGGWSARSQRGEAGHPEVTAWVLPALVRAGLDATQRTRLVSRFEAMLDPKADAGLESTAVVATCLSALAELAPTSPRATELADYLCRSSTTIEADGGRRCAWSDNLAKPDAELSTPHTARAVVALHRLVSARGDRSALRTHDKDRWLDVSHAGAEWLLANADFGLFDEAIRRTAGEDRDEIVVGHFTPAWVARALMATGKIGDMKVLQTAVRLTLARQTEGVWRWNRGAVEPLWMSYQGVSVIQEYSMRNLPWPP